MTAAITDRARAAATFYEVCGAPGMLLDPPNARMQTLRDLCDRRMRRARQ